MSRLFASAVLAVILLGSTIAEVVFGGLLQQACGLPAP